MHKLQDNRIYPHTFQSPSHQPWHSWTDQSLTYNNTACWSICALQPLHNPLWTYPHPCLWRTSASWKSCRTWTPHIRKCSTGIWQTRLIMFVGGCYWWSFRRGSRISCWRGHGGRKRRRVAGGWIRLGIWRRNMTVAVTGQVGGRICWDSVRRSPFCCCPSPLRQG